MYVIHKKTKKAHDPFLLPAVVPPSSPKLVFLLINRKIMQIQAQMTNTITVKPREAAGTKYLLFVLLSLFMKHS